MAPPKPLFDDKEEHPTGGNLKVNEDFAKRFEASVLMHVGCRRRRPGAVLEFA